METRSNPTSDNPASGSGAEPTPLSADGLVLVPLAAAEEEVRRAILRYKSLGSFPVNKLAALEGLKKLPTDIQAAASPMHREQTLPGLYKLFLSRI